MQTAEPDVGEIGHVVDGLVLWKARPHASVARVDLILVSRENALTLLVVDARDHVQASWDA